jgi:hypothetical protein
VEYLIIFAILGAVVVFVTAPVRRAGGAPEPGPDVGEAGDVADLEAAREAKLRDCASSGTPSSTTARASCPTPTTRTSTGRSAERRSRF